MEKSGRSHLRQEDTRRNEKKSYKTVVRPAMLYGSYVVWIGDRVSNKKTEDGT